MSHPLEKYRIPILDVDPDRVYPILSEASISDPVLSLAKNFLSAATSHSANLPLAKLALLSAISQEDTGKKALGLKSKEEELIRVQQELLRLSSNRGTGERQVDRFREECADYFSHLWMLLKKEKYLAALIVNGQGSEATKELRQETHEQIGQMLKGLKIFEPPYDQMAVLMLKGLKEEDSVFGGLAASEHRAANTQLLRARTDEIEHSYRKLMKRSAFGVGLLGVGVGYAGGVYGRQYDDDGYNAVTGKDYFGHTPEGFDDEILNAVNIDQDVIDAINELEMEDPDFSVDLY